MSSAAAGPSFASQASHRLRTDDAGAEAARHTAAFVLSFRCPLSCRHCPQTTEQRRSGIFAAPTLLEAIAGAARAKRTTAIFTGGEPTLHLPLLAAALDAARGAGMATMVTSAPVWASSEVTADRLLERLPRFDVLVLSFDAFHLEQLSLEHYARAVAAARRRHLNVALNVSAADNASATELLRAGSAFARDACAVNVQPAIPLRQAIADRGASACGHPVRSPDDLLGLARSCNAGDALIDFDLQVHFCCWGSAATDSPLGAVAGDGATVGPTLAAMDRSPHLSALQRRGLVGVLSDDARRDIATRASGRMFVNECHLCTFLMEPGNRDLWRRYVGPTARDICDAAEAR